MKKCTWCGKEYPDSATVCFIDKFPLKDVVPADKGITCSVCSTVNPARRVFCSRCKLNLHMKHPGARFDPNAAGDNGEDRKERPQPQESGRREQIPTASFSCFQCDGNLRIRLPQTDSTFRCPKCRAEFRVTKAGDSPLVFVVVPDLSQYSPRSSQTREQPKREIPREVRNALAVFSLADSASFEEIRSAYRKQILSYHPDKVAHLGPELKRVAEAKTTEFNLAYEVLEEFYAA